MEHWDVVHTIIHTLHVELKIPVTAKMRVFDDTCMTLKYARMIRDAGAHVIAVHGRTREQKGQETGLADLEQIRLVREHVGEEVPVIGNGNVLIFDDIDSNLSITGCHAVMSAEALLWDPRLFSNPRNPVLTGRTFNCSKHIRLEALATALEYLEIVERYPVDLGLSKAHLFKMLYHSYEIHTPMRHALGDFNCNEGTVSLMKQHVLDLKAMEESSTIVDAPPKPTTKQKQETRRTNIPADEDFCIDFST